MKRFLLLVLATFVAAPAFSAETKPNTLVCISQKKLKKFQQLEKSQEFDFIDKMHKRAECVYMKEPMKIAIDAEVGEYIRFQRLDGLKLWMKKEGLNVE